MAYTQVAGTITGVTGNVLTVQLTATQGHNVAAFQVGETISVTVPTGATISRARPLRP